MSILPDNSDEVGDKLDKVLELLHDATDHHRLSAAGHLETPAGKRKETPSWRSVSQPR